MLSIEEALGRIGSAVTPLPSGSTPLLDAANRFSAVTLFAAIPLPGFDNSAMDGYAVRAVDTRGSNPLPVVDVQPAGQSLGLTLPPHAAIRIFTGAPLPAGADAVIMQEDVEVVEREGQKHIVCREPVQPGENIRLAGCDLCAGQKILSPGERLTPTRLGVLASQGLAEAEVYGAPRVAVVTTGDELRRPGEPLQPGQIYGSNGIMLRALLKSMFTLESASVHLPDGLEETETALRSLIQEKDFIILTGGVSVGERDYVKPALRRLGFEPEFWQVKIRPGKPMLFVKATSAEGRPCYIFGLPGNPVSSFVTFLVFVRPALLKAMGAAPSEMALPSATVELAVPLSNRGDRPLYLCGRVTGNHFAPEGLRQSHALFGLSQANAVVRLEPGESLAQGAALEAMRFG